MVAGMRNNFKIILSSLMLSLLVLGSVFLIFGALYHYDNKYTQSPPYGSNGIFSFKEEDLNRPLFLIDGWELYPGQLLAPDRFSDGTSEYKLTTFIGQYPNFSYLPGMHSPFGEATYRLTLQYTGEARILTLEIPEIFTDYTLWINDRKAAENGSGTIISFPSADETILTLTVANHTHYYSGLTYPPALGQPGIINRMLLVRCLFYALLCIPAVTLALFSSILWLTRERDSLFLHFGLLCLFYAVHCMHPFIWQFGRYSTLWYAAEDTSWLIVLTETAAIASIISGLYKKNWYHRLIRPVTYGACILCFICVLFIIPNNPDAVKWYGILSDWYRIALWAFLAVCTGIGLHRHDLHSFFTLGGCCILGSGLLSNILDNNLYEPVYTGWQTEYAGLLLVIMFAVFMIRRNAAILKENKLLTTHLEEQVTARTQELQAVLDERKNFFSDMAHNLKAPITAIHGFITLIREGNVRVDDELHGYISLIESENLEMRRRVQSLNTLNAFDRINGPMECIAVDDLLTWVYDYNEPEASAAGIHFQVDRLDSPVQIYGQREKLCTMFENLIYNAISFTPMEGTIHIIPAIEGHSVSITVRDSGCGITSEHLPRIFDRFYSARDNKQEGSGLGLYITRITAEELGGSIHAESEPGKGSTFIVQLPIR